MLGTHVQQKGSLVSPERTRFDFAHGHAMSAEQIFDVERLVNAEILANAATEAAVMELEAAQKSGAMMLFGEKYGDTVRVLSIGSSKELCGGTHVQRAGDIGLFKIVAEGAVAAGIRRVEAVTGSNALAYLQTLEGRLGQIASGLKVAPVDAAARVEGLLDHIKQLDKEVAQLKGKLASAQGDQLAEQAVEVAGIKLLVAKIDGADAATLRGLLDKLRDKLKSAAIVLASVDGDKVQLGAAVTADLTGKLKGRRAGQLCCRPGGRQGRRQAGHGDGRRQPARCRAGGPGLGARLGGAARLSRSSPNARKPPEGGFLVH